MIRFSSCTYKLSTSMPPELYYIYSLVHAHIFYLIITDISSYCTVITVNSRVNYFVQTISYKPTTELYLCSETILQTKQSHQLQEIVSETHLGVVRYAKESNINYVAIFHFNIDFSVTQPATYFHFN